MGFRFGYIIFFILVLNSGKAQDLLLADATAITQNSSGNGFPAWSPDGSLVVFQSNQLGSWDLYCYSLESDSIWPLLVSEFNLKHPVWHPDGKHLVFDSDSLGYQVLFSLNLTTKKISRLINRDVIGSQASFASSGRQVYFSGFDKTGRHCQIYSYDFVYDNLNQLTYNKTDSQFPKVSPDGKRVGYFKTNRYNELSSLQVINWYGEKLATVAKPASQYHCWDSGGLKIYYTAAGKKGKTSLFSIWTDGSHVTQLTEDNLNVSHSAISPDGNRMILSVDKNGQTNLYIFNMPE